jgi:hypothetical protein
MRPEDSGILGMAFAAERADDERRDRIKQLEDLLKEAIIHLTWCGGSFDFGPDGKAHMGWKRGPDVFIHKAEMVLKKGDQNE